MPEPKRCSCCEKHTLRAEEEKKKLLNRLRRIEGQVRGLQAMVESNAYCNDILTQSAAVNAAVNAFNRELLDLGIAVRLRLVDFGDLIGIGRNDLLNQYLDFVLVHLEGFLLFVVELKQLCGLV